MANFTPNVNLEKPLGSEHYLIPKFNANMDKIDAEFNNKVDKELNKVLSSNDYTDSEKTKLSGIAEGANNYSHPVSHLPNIIEQDSNNRFVTDVEKNAWNSKAPIANPTFTGLITTGGQIKFPATQVPSSDPNTLDDYEEGTWTPSLVGSTGTSNHTYGQRTGNYIKIGKLVMCQFFIHIITKDAGVGGQLYITGLPFSIGAEAGASFAQVEGIAMPTAFQNQLVGYGTGSLISLRGLSNGSYDAVQASGLSSTSYIIGTIVYGTN